jgi:hypothetical protein
VREYIGCAVVLTAVILSQIDFASIRGKLNEKRASEQDRGNK